MKYGINIILIFFFIFCQKVSIGQSSKKLTKEERKQEQKNIDSLFIVQSLPIKFENAKDFPFVKLKDSIITILNKKGFDCPNEATIKSLMLEKMLDFLPSPTEKERYKEVMEKVAKDNSYYFKLMELADPFLQTAELSLEKNKAGVSFISVKRQNFPYLKKNKIWTFEYDASEPVINLARRIVDTLTNTKQSQ